MESLSQHLKSKTSGTELKLSKKKVGNKFSDPKCGNLQCGAHSSSA